MMNSVLKTYDSISLDEMGVVRLMNRVDRKYVTTLSVLETLLQMARDSYFVQCVDGVFEMPYHTIYYDTSDADMYIEHLRGRKRRQKIRIRSYELSQLSFLEVKNKNNKGCTEKRRIQYRFGECDDFERFIEKYSNYPKSELSQRIENRFSRITLVNRNFTERLTIDTHLKFHNLVTDDTCSMDDLVIIELKRSGNSYSPAREILRQLRIHPVKFSKYCMGMALTDSDLRVNRFKPRLRQLDKMCNITKGIGF